MQKFFASTVLSDENPLAVKARVYVGSAKSLAAFLYAVLASAEDELLVIYRAAELSQWRPEDFDAPIDMDAVRMMEMKPGHLVAGEPYPGTLPEALPQTGCKMAVIALETPDGPEAALVATKADRLAHGLRIILSDAERGGADLVELEGLMDAELHQGEGYSFAQKPEALIARIKEGESIALAKET